MIQRCQKDPTPTLARARSAAVGCIASPLVAVSAGVKTRTRRLIVGWFGGQSIPRGRAMRLATSRSERARSDAMNLGYVRSRGARGPRQIDITSTETPETISGRTSSSSAVVTIWSGMGGSQSSCVIPDRSLDPSRPSPVRTANVSPSHSAKDAAGPVPSICAVRGGSARTLTTGAASALHSKPYVAGFYAWKYGGEELSRRQVEDRLEELLDLGRREESVERMAL